jgi:hypothetical protein
MIAAEYLCKIMTAETGQYSAVAERLAAAI